MLQLARTANVLRRYAAVAISIVVAGLFLSVVVTITTGQPPQRRREPWEIEPTEETQRRVEELIDEIVDPQITIKVDPRKSRLIRTKRPISRFSITNPGVIDIVQFSPTEFELVGNSVGITTMTIWYPGTGDEPEIIRYLVRVSPDDTAALEYGELQDRVNELFPCSQIQLIPVADKILVRGQAKDATEAAQILSIIGGEQIDQAGNILGRGSNLNLGTIARPYLDESDLPAGNLINLLEVPGEQQIMLRVRVAELSRASVRAIGADLSFFRGDFTFNSLFGGTTSGPVTAVFSTDDVNLAMSVLNGNSYGRSLAEPNLVTINGRPASFNVGGSFAVPTVVGVGGVGAVSTDFQSFGTNVTFTPFLIEKDRIRLQVSPSITEPDSSNTVNGIPGISGTSIFTTIDLREGQWMAIGGLVQEDQEGGKTRKPFIGDIPILNTFFSQRNTLREEQEIVIFVSPELVRPLEAEEVPLILPGMDITEPTDWDFFFLGRHQGKQGYHYRSTVWLEQQDRIIQAHREAMKDARQLAKYQECEACYVYGDHGFSY